MANLKELYKYVNYDFSTGCYVGEDYKTFEKKYINYLKSIAKEYGWQLCDISKGHYCFSTFIKNDEKYVYISIPDVRGRNNNFWNNILYRTAKSNKDYCGGQNNYTNIGNLKYAIYWLFSKER